MFFFVEGNDGHSPLGTVEFMKYMNNFNQLKFKKGVLQNEHGKLLITYFDNKRGLKFADLIVRSYSWLCCYLLKMTREKIGKEGDSFNAHNNAQIYLAHTLSIAYFEVK